MQVQIIVPPSEACDVNKLNTFVGASLRKFRAMYVDEKRSEQTGAVTLLFDVAQPNVNAFSIDTKHTGYTFVG